MGDNAMKQEITLQKPTPLKYGQMAWELANRKKQTTEDLIKDMPPRLRGQYRKVLK